MSPTSPQYTLYVGSKNVSSWSMRGWLVMKKTSLPFEEKLIHLDTPQTKQSILAVSPSARVPALHVHRTNLTIWDSLAIAEYLHEVCPSAELWPKESDARAIA